MGTPFWLVRTSEDAHAGAQAEAPRALDVQHLAARDDAAEHVTEQQAPPRDHRNTATTTAITMSQKRVPTTRAQPIQRAA